MRAGQLKTIGMALVIAAAGSWLAAGSAAAQHGDFNGDGFSDLAIGVPFEDIGTLHDVGLVNVIYGGPFGGLNALGNQIWQQGVAGLPDVGEGDDLFGAALAACDFNGDGFDDLTVGAPGEDIGAAIDAGVVVLIFGTPFGLTGVGAQLLTQSQVGAIPDTGDGFGAALAAGDFNGDGFCDLAVGAPGETLGPIVSTGEVDIFHGSAFGLGGAQIWHQDITGIPEVAEDGDAFGFALASGDFDDDDFDDLAIGIPGESVGIRIGAGAVQVLYGTWPGLAAAGNLLLHQDVPGVLARAEDGDAFGFSLATGDFNGDLFSDLAVGVPLEDLYEIPGKIPDVGAVNVFYGFHEGLVIENNQFWHQDADLLERAEAGDQFGFALASGNFNGDAYYDLAVGVPLESVFQIDRAGAVNVIYGSTKAGLNSAGNQLWHQNSPNILGLAERWEEFGFSLASGDYDADGFYDLSIGVPLESIGPLHEAGAVNTIYGRSNGLRASGNQMWHQNVPGILDVAEKGDAFGFALSGH